MLEKLISNLKQSLPGGASKNAGSDASAPAPGLGKKNVNVQVAMAAAASGEEEAKKRNSMIVKVIVICGLAYLAVDELFLKEQAPVETTAAKPVKKPKKNKPNKENIAEKTQGAPVAGDASQAQAENQNGETANPQSENNPPPIENINVLNKDNNQVAQPATEPAPQPTIDNSKIGEVNLDQKIDQIAKSVDQVQIQNQVEEIKIPSQPASQPQSPNVVIHDPQPMEAAPQTQRDTSMASKIVEDAVETAAPAYDQIGRGLVYNCKDKYWACLNKPAYLECNKNMKWNLASGKPAECVVQDIYNSDEDCSKVQKYHINVSTPTPFCN